MSSCKCARCEAVGDFEVYFMRWNCDWNGLFAMCDECIKYYAHYVVEEREEEEEEEEEENEDNE